MKTVQLKSNVERRVTKLVSTLNVKGWYIKVMVRSSTMKGSTEQAVYVTYQCVWSVSMRIAHDSHLDINYWLHKIL